MGYNSGMSEPSPINPWSSILRSLPLTKAENEVVKRFEIEPEGRSFLPVADILRAHRLTDEALELLTQGVDRHPNFSVARVVLARELLQKGMIESSWRILDESPSPLRSNVLAQKLKLKLALIQGSEAEADAIINHLHIAQLHDVETKRISDLVTSKGHAKAREKLIQEIRDKGIEPLLPPLPQRQESLQAGKAEVVASSEKSGGSKAHRSFDSDADGFFHSVSEFLDMESLGQDVAIRGFHVTSLSEIFRPELSAAPEMKGAGGIELDSTTLADIYAGQGHYGKALDMYRRLLRTSPQNDLVKRRVAELARLEREQRSDDLSIDPSLVDVMESVEIIDRQIKFYSELLMRLA
jgi:hypothetical protein